MTAHLVSRRQMKPSQIEAPKTAGMEMKYLNRSRRLPTNRAAPIPPAMTTAMTARPTASRCLSDFGATNG